MDWLIILVIILVLGQAATLYVFWQRGQTKSNEAEENQSFLMMQQQLQELTRAMDMKLGEGTRTMSEFMSVQSDQARALMSTISKQVSDQLLEVVKGVTETKESTKQVFTIAEQLNNLEKVLKNQKQRGNLGERSLELVLSNILPPNLYNMQYEFPGGETVDAAIFTNDGIIPIDAKFPLENYTRMIDEADEERRTVYADEFKRDLKKRIDETSKYIRPKDGTLSIAFMYIPSEAIYYDLLNDGIGAVNTRNLLDYAQNEKKVTIVSPTTFAAYLTSVLYGFKAFKIERDAENIKKNVENLTKHLAAYEDFYKRLGSSLSTTVNHWNAGYKELGKVDKDVLKITGEAAGLDVNTIERPVLEGKD